jgi:hypothetical protein
MEDREKKNTFYKVLNLPSPSVCTPPQTAVKNNGAISEFDCVCIASLTENFCKFAGVVVGSSEAF